MTIQTQTIPTLLWTGGWDSTFRLLQRLLIEQQPIQPVYVVNPDRQSAIAEIRTMKKIKQRLIAEYPHVRSTLHFGKTVGFYDFDPHPVYQDAYDRILARQYLGTQYVWLASFCDEMNIRDIELAIHQDDKAHRILAPLVTSAGAEGCYQVDDRFAHTDEYRLFRFFRLPIFDLTKTQMLEIARAEGFEELMKLTWFCHTPSRKQRPCGTCNPCIYAIEEGLGDRVPWWGRFKYHCRGLASLKPGHA